MALMIGAAGARAGRYYRPELLTADDTTASRTGYKWGFAKKLDELEMGSLRDRIHRDTAAGGAAQADSVRYLHSDACASAV